MTNDADLDCGATDSVASDGSLSAAATAADLLCIVRNKYGEGWCGPLSSYIVGLMPAPACEAAPGGCWPAAIPKHIYFSFKAKVRIPDFVVDAWRTLNPGFHFSLFDDEECATFVRKHYGQEMVETYRRIPSGPIRADLWRLLVLLVRGGVYVDVDVEPLMSLRSFVHPTDRLVTSASRYPGTVNPHLLISRPREPLLHGIMQRMLQTLRPGTAFSFRASSVCSHMWREMNATFGKSFSHETNVGGVFRDASEPTETYRLLREIVVNKPRRVKATATQAGAVVCYNKWNASVWDMCGPNQTWPHCPQGGFTDAYVQR
jgi:hypothetical protein